MANWRLVNPEGVVSGETFRFGRRPNSLEGKTVLLRWNGKHNGDIFLAKVGELLTEKVKGIKVVKNWEVAPGTSETSSSPELSQKFAATLAALKPDLAIASTGD